MKKLFVIIAALGALSFAASAQTTDSTTVQTKVTANEEATKEAPVEAEFVAIEVSEIPEHIATSITKQFPTATVQSATKNTNNDHKVTVLIDGKEQVLVIREKAKTEE